MKWKTPEAFTKAVKGKKIDIDGAYGYQCWDLAVYFWQNQVGRAWSNGGYKGVKGGWMNAAARIANAGSEFELITNAAALKPGDWLVTSTGAYGHIGMVTEVVRAGVQVKLLGQNQVAGKNGTEPANIVNFYLGNFLGAFRLKAWNQPTPTPKPTAKPISNKEATLFNLSFKTASGGNYSGKNLTIEEVVKKIEGRTKKTKVNEVVDFKLEGAK